MMPAFSREIIKRKKEGLVPVIPDFKHISPKDGDLFGGRDYIEIARRLSGMGTPVFSVVTESGHFGGSLKLLEEIVKATNKPVLRKDFIRDPDDLKATKDSGAAAVLLMCAVLEEKTLFKLYNEAINIGLEPFVEAHSLEHLEFVKKIGADLVGINNKDILKLEKDSGTVLTTENLAGFAPENAVLVSESGIGSPGDVKAAVNAGADAVLVGTALWRADNLEYFYSSLCNAKGEES